MGFIVENAVHHYFAFLRSHVVQVEVGVTSGLEFRSKRSLRRDAGDGGLLGISGCYGEQCYCGAHGSSLGLPPSEGHHAPAFTRIVWAEGIESTAHLPCSVSSKFHSAHSPSVAFFRLGRIGTRRSTLKLCSSASCLHINVGHCQSNSLSTPAFCRPKHTAPTS